MTATIIVLFALGYALMGRLTVLLGTRIYRGKGAAPLADTQRIELQWPVVLPMLLYVLAAATFRTITNWPNGPENT